jgi:hypothetical protein
MDVLLDEMQNALVLGRTKPAVGQGDRDAGSDGPLLVDERRGTGRNPVGTVMGVRSS